MKMCSSCRQEKTLEEFWPDKGRKDGHARVCMSCVKEHRRKNYALRITEERARANARYAANAIHINKVRKQWKERNPEKVWATTLKKYGITVQDYHKLLEAQSGGCAICHTFPTNFRLAVDHCHTTKLVRGLLCNTCNRGIGNFKDDAFRLQNAATYLTKVKPQREIV